AMARVWGDCLRGRGQTFQGQAKTIDDYLAALPAEKRAALQNFDWLNTPFFPNLERVDGLSGYTERSLWPRLQLWRVSCPPVGAPPVPSFGSDGQCLGDTFHHIAGIAVPAATSSQEHCGDILGSGDDESQHLALLVQAPSSSGL